MIACLFSGRQSGDSVFMKANGLKEQNFGQTDVAARTDEGEEELTSWKLPNQCSNPRLNKKCCYFVD